MSTEPMSTEPRGPGYDPARVEAVCVAVHRAAAAGVDLDRAVPEIVALTGGDVSVARAALSVCARRSLQRSDGWFQAARLLERALATDAFASG
jgi:hypothetical protein